MWEKIICAGAIIITVIVIALFAYWANFTP